MARPERLAAAGLACRRGGREVFAGVEFALAAGAALLLRGRNGAGKSSLLRLLAGFATPAAGRLAWDGAPIGEDPAEHRARTHYVGSGDAAKPALSARESLAFHAALAGGRPSIEVALAAFALDELADLPVRYLSTGQRRRLSLARLMATERPLWLLDEPGVGLDRASRALLEAVIAGHRAAGGVAVIATHGDVAVEDALVLDLDG